MPADFDFVRVVNFSDLVHFNKFLYIAKQLIVN